ncbi:MAG: right-handed parallel beta-helix repeat-containing protein, partial [Deltaproteobacteria bacterium]|nr:right-handed parallel beta-helix repeat-containing protein [Deltaproteobacteria bacterium]
EFGFGIQVSAGASMVAEDCLLVRNARIGLLVMQSGTHVTLTDVIVRETLPNENQPIGVGVTVADGATLTASGLVVEDSLGTGVMAYGDGTSVHLDGGAVRATAYQETAAGGIGINVFNGASVTAVGTVVEDTVVAGVMFQDDGSVGQLDGVEVHGNRGHEGGTLAGLVVTEGSVVQASDLILEGNVGLGLYLSGPGTEVALVGGEIRDGTYDEEAEVGGGILATGGATLVAEAVDVAGNQGAGIDLLDAGTVGYLTQVTVSDTDPEPSGAFGRGISALGGASLHADYCVLGGNTWAGLIAFDEDTEVVLTNVTIEDTRPDSMDQGGVGIEVAAGASLTAVGGVVRGNHRVGVAVFEGGTVVDLTGVTIEDTLPVGDGAGQGGYGLQVAAGGTLVLTDCTVQRNTRAGVLAFEDTTLQIQGGTVRDSYADSYGEFGRGICGCDGASLTLTDVVVEGNMEIGIQLLDQGTHAALAGVEVVGTLRGPQSTSAVGLLASHNADVVAQDLAVRDTEGPGVYVTSLASLQCTGCALDDNAFAGLTLRNSYVTWDGGVIRGTVADATTGGGVGIFADDYQGAPSLWLQGATVEVHPYAAVWLSGNGAYELVANVIHGGPCAELTPGLEFHGDAVYAREVTAPWDGSLGLSLQGNTIQDADGAGVFLDGATATLSGNTYAGNAFDVVQQRCSGVDGPSGIGEAGTTELCPAYDHLVAPLSFQLYLEEIAAQE